MKTSKAIAILKTLEINAWESAIPLDHHLLSNTVDKHKNTLVTLAIATKQFSAATILIMCLPKPILNKKDQFATSQSTPLILTAKMHVNSIALLLIGLSAKLDSQDYRGFTALHYAAITLNKNLFDALLLKGANSEIQNQFGKTALDYLTAKVDEHDLSYPYGVDPNNQYRLAFVNDFTQLFTGTSTPDYSAIRWFIGTIILNNPIMNKLSSAVYITLSSIPAQKNKITPIGPEVPRSLKTLLEVHELHNVPIRDSRIFSTAIWVFSTASHFSKYPEMQSNCLKSLD